MRVTPPPLQAWRPQGPGTPERMSSYCPLGERERRTGRRGKGCWGSSLSDSAQAGRGVAQSLVSHRSPRAFYKWGEQKPRKAPSRRERAVAHRVHPQGSAHVERTLPRSCSKRRPLRFYRRAATSLSERAGHPSLKLRSSNQVDGPRGSLRPRQGMCKVKLFSHDTKMAFAPSLGWRTGGTAGHGSLGRRKAAGQQRTVSLKTVLGEAAKTINFMKSCPKYLFLRLGVVNRKVNAKHFWWSPEYKVVCTKDPRETVWVAG